MANELTPLRQTEVYEKLRKIIKEQIRTDRQSGHPLTRLGGFLKGLVLKFERPPAVARQVDLAPGRLVAQALPVLNFALPLLGTALKLAAQKGLDMLEQQGLMAALDDPKKPPTLEAQAQWLARFGADKIDTSILKLQGAQEDFAKRSARGVSDCEDFYALVHSFEYWQYRQERLLKRTKFLEKYAQALTTELEKAGAQMDHSREFVDGLAKSVFGAYHWHVRCARAGGECVYPWDDDVPQRTRFKEVLAAAHGNAAPPGPAVGQVVRSPPPPAGRAMPGATVRRPPPPARPN